MPRPGPRPYECVRRAWHSDRHQPMRGSLIQEIFRVVNEIHSSATRKNKEWQDKLPIVVLKAEDIMYSKANSEAEYMDLETLWDRANDAINTIIRLDESTETGVFLQPCIEAALNLGCTPMRTSRSQRNNTSTYYLNIKNGDPNSCPTNNLHKTTQETPFVSHYSQIMKPRTINLSPFNIKPQIPILPNNKSFKSKFPFPSPPSDKLYPCQTTKPPSVYPLYYGAPSEPSCELKENGEMGFVQNPFFHQENGKSDPKVSYECDLSLRLGPSSQISQPRHVGDSGNSKKWSLDGERLEAKKWSLDGEKLELEAKKWSLESGKVDLEAKKWSLDGEKLDLKAKKWSLDGESLDLEKIKWNLDSEKVDLEAKRWSLDGENLDLEARKWSLDGEKMDLEARMRKRKAVVSNLYENLQFCWSPKVSSANSNGGGSLTNAGL